MKNVITWIEKTELQKQKINKDDWLATIGLRRDSMHMRDSQVIMYIAI